MSITLLQGRHLSKLVIILISFWFSACFIFAAYKLRLRIGFANFGDLGIFKGVEGVQKIQLCGSGNDIGRVNILKTASNKYDRLLEAKFTIALSTYQRPKELNDTLTVLLTPIIPSLLEIVVVWNNIGEAPPEAFVSEHGVTVRYRASEHNSLNEKFQADPTYRTRAILLSDDDVYYNPSDLEFVFQTWRKFGQTRLTGALARCASLDSNTKRWNYDFCEHKDVYSMIITNLAFADISFLDYYFSDEPLMEEVRMYVDDKFNCEDIALNFVASMLTCEGPLLVRGRDPYVTYDPMGGISRRPGHMQTRSQCLNDFTEMFGFMPLIYEQARVDFGPKFD